MTMESLPLLRSFVIAALWAGIAGSATGEPPPPVPSSYAPCWHYAHAPGCPSGLLYGAPLHPGHYALQAEIFPPGPVFIDPYSPRAEVFPRGPVYYWPYGYDTPLYGHR